MIGIGIVIIVAVILGVAAWVMVHEEDKIKELEKNQGLGSPLTEYNEKTKARKGEEKAKILEILHGKGRITNDEVQKTLQVSDATATRYLDDLEKDGKILQQGEAKASYYILVNGSYRIEP